jgi:hypothetical protein
MVTASCAGWLHSWFSNKRLLHAEDRVEPAVQPPNWPPTLPSHCLCIGASANEHNTMLSRKYGYAQQLGGFTAGWSVRKQRPSCMGYPAVQPPSQKHQDAWVAILH